MLSFGARICVSKRYINLLMAVLACHAFAVGESRWCTVSGPANFKRLIYPPLARASHLSGVVLLLATYRPTGEILTTEVISGPQMLADSAREQIQEWKMSTTASGDQPCQTLIIAKFNILPENYGISPTHTKETVLNDGILRTFVDSYTIVISDPVTVIRRRRRFLIF